LARGRQFLARHSITPLGEGEMHLLTRGLDAQVEQAISGHWNDRAIELLVVLAVAYAVAGDDEAAQAALLRALRLGQPEGYVRRFVDEGLPMARLLYRFVQQADDAQDPVTRYASELLAFFPEQASPNVDAPTRSEAPSMPDHIDPLTPRETEVLHLIADGLTNQEIADQLFISYETVKVHSRNIYQKLDVGGRTQAVARARGLGLLSSV
jgi:LuxR family maltose regulon positive regulatory protein